MNDAAAQLVPGLLLVLGVLGVGAPVAIGIGTRLELPTATRLGLVPLLGVAILGVITLVIGHVHLIGAWLPPAIFALGIAASLVARHEILVLLHSTASGLRSQWRMSPIAIAATATGMAIAVVAALAPPFRTDEVEYHWPAALQWAEVGYWVDSDFRHVDGFPLMEITYTAAATWQSYGAAHWLHLLTLVGLGLCAGGAARGIGLRGSAAVGTAAMAMPVVWDGAYAAYNDTAVGAFGTAAAAVVLGARRPFAAPALATAALLCSLAISVKPTGLGSVGVIALILMLVASHHRTVSTNVSWTVLRSWVFIALPAGATYLFWISRRWHITGSPFDAVASAAPNADALSRLPTAADRIVQPFMPFVTGVLGASEPWGGRTAVVLQILLVPALVYVLWRRGPALGRFALVAAPAWLHWLVMGIAGVRTRFHIVTWTLLVVAVRSAFEDWVDRHPRWGRWAEVMWGLCVAAGILDISLEMLRLINSHIIGGT